MSFVIIVITGNSLKARATPTVSFDFATFARHPRYELCASWPHVINLILIQLNVYGMPYETELALYAGEYLRIRN